MSGHSKYFTILIFLFPVSLEPLLSNALKFSPFQSNIRKILLNSGNPLGSVLGFLFAESTFSPSDFIHKHSFTYHPCTTDSSPDFSEVQIHAVNCFSENSTWILKCNFTLSNEKSSFLREEGS